MKRFISRLNYIRASVLDRWDSWRWERQNRRSADAADDSPVTVSQGTPPQMTIPVVAQDGILEALVINPAWPRHQLTRFRPQSLADVPADAIWIKDDRPFVVLQHTDHQELPAADGEVLWTFPGTNRFGMRRAQQEWVPLLDGYRYEMARRVLAQPAAAEPQPEAEQSEAAAVPISPELAATNGHSANGHMPTKGPMTNAQMIQDSMEGRFSSLNKPIRPADFGAHLDMRLVRERRTSSRQKELQKALDKAKPWNWIALAIVLGLVALVYFLGQSA